jgi:amino acid adenylation domain-containing protein/non-ribosomal peptide synthase protein (TIGR01720 family)
MNTYTLTSNSSQSQIFVPSQSQRQLILTKLCSIIANLLKSNPEEVDIYSPFLEMGADSIVLIDAIRNIENTFGIKISIRQLFEELTNLEALAIYIEQNTSWETPVLEHTQSPEVVPTIQTQHQPKMLPPIGLSPHHDQLAGTVSDNLLEDIISLQMQLMSQQLEVLRSSSLHSKELFTVQNGYSHVTPQSITSTVDFTKNAVPKPAPASTKAAPASSVLPPWRVAEIRARGLKPQQQNHLEDLIVRYSQRTPTSKKLTQTYRPVLADNRASAGFRFSTKEMLYPIMGERSQGSKIWDIDNNEYIDLTMGFGVNLFGHNPEFITVALEEQLKKGIQIGPQTRLAGEVAQLISELTGLERVNFSNSGTEAVMTALRLARTATGRNKIVIFNGSYHGHFDGTLGMLKPGLENMEVMPIAPGITPKIVEDLLVLDYGNPQSLEIIKEHAHELAAVLVEPVQSRRPDLQPKEFLQELRRLTRETGVLLIMDEMITGFRIHPGGAQAWFGIDADIATYGKIVGGGMPIGVVAGKARYMDGIDGGMWNYGDASYPQADTTFLAGTFSKHPLTMAAARAILQELKRCGPSLQSELNQRTAKLATTLNAYFELENLPIRIVHFGSLFRFAISENVDLLFYHLLYRGIYIWEGRNCFLSAAHTEGDINYFIQAIKESVEELRSGRFFPESPSMSSLQGEKQSNEVLASVSIVPLTTAQKQLWVLTQIEEDGSLAYNVSVSAQLKGNLQLGVMRRVLQQLVDRHEALRTTISSQGDVQQILSSLRLDVPLVDFSGTDKEEVATWFKNESSKLFDLTNGQLLRAHILKLEEELHILVLTAHHIVVDGWSMGVMLQELSTLYSAECQGVASQLSSPMQYREYVWWQEQQSLTGEIAKHEAYWLQQFAHSIPVLELPCDRPRPPVKTYKGSRQTLRFDASLCGKIRQLGKQNGCTLFMTLLAGYTTLLYRLTEQDDIIVGIPASGRLEGSEGMVGYCSHLLPIRNHIVGDASFSQHLRTQRSILLEAYEHQDYPFAKLIEKLNVKRDVSMSALVTTTFNLERPIDVPEMYGLQTKLHAQPIGFADYDLSFNVTEIGDELMLDCDYNTDLFDAATIDRLLEHFQTLLQGLVADPEQSLSQLPLLTAAQKQQLLVEWNNTQIDYPNGKCIHQLFEAQVQKTPDAVAVEFAGQKLTYDELNCRANQLAHYLQSLGVKPEVLVGICVERSLKMLVGILGILKAGGAYLPLDPAYPPERLGYMLSDAQVSVLLTTAKLQANLPTHLAEVVCLDTDWLEISRQSDANPVSDVQPENLVYVIYTSGSTGKSKGVLISHQGLVNHSCAIVKDYQLTVSDRILQFASLSFDVAAEEIFPTWLSGAILVLRPTEIPTIADFAQFVQEAKITVLNLPVSYWQEWVNQMPQASWPENVRLLIVGSDKVQLEQFVIWQKHVDNNVNWRNAYGPTEATITATVYSSALSSKATNTNFLPIGLPIANTQIYILDRHLQPVPIGVKGELHIGGAGLARGYLNRPELTADKFIPNPFDNSQNSKIYKTGDLARYLPDGTIEFIGRIDHQVKIRGFRIELGEIETVLTQHPQVQESVVVASSDQNGNQRLIAYIVWCQEPPHNSELRRFLKEKLPEYMIPSVFVALESLPLLPNGKLDRHALPTPEASSPEQVEAIAPRSDIEKTLAQIWVEILGRKQVGIHDNFFELGGDSILCLQMVAKANQLGLQFTPKQLFQHQTIAELADVVDRAPAIQAEQGLVTGSVALTPIQHWFFSENLPEPHHYNQSVLLEVPPNLEPKLLEQTVQHLLVHHDALRLRYQQSTSTWQQINAAPDETISFTVVDLSELPSQQQPVAIESSASQMQTSFDLSQGPIVGVVLFHLGNHQSDRLLFIIHHLAVDGVSWRILLEDLFTVYQQLLQGSPIQFPPKTTSFKEWASLLNTYAKSEAVSRELHYWLTPSHAEITSLPTDYHRSKAANTVASTKEVLVGLSREQTQSLLREVPSAYNTQINDVLLAALVKAFARWAGNNNLLIDLEGHGREQLFANVDLSRTVGWFTTVFPVLLRLTHAENPGEILKSIKEQLRSIPNHGIGYGLLRYLSPDATTSSQLATMPQAEVSFNYLGQLDGGWSQYPGVALAKESSGLTTSPLGSCTHLLEVDGFVVDGKLQFTWKYSENIYRRATVEYLAQTLIEELEILIAHCLQLDAGGYTPSDFPEVDLNQGELDELLDEFAILEDSSLNFLEESENLLDRIDREVDTLLSEELKDL